MTNNLIMGPGAMRQGCEVCTVPHPPTQKCMPELLRKMILDFKVERIELARINREALAAGEDLRRMLIAAGKEMEILMETEKKYNALVEEINGIKQIRTDASEEDNQLSFPEV